MSVTNPVTNTTKFTLTLTPEGGSAVSAEFQSFNIPGRAEGSKQSLPTNERILQDYFTDGEVSNFTFTAPFDFTDWRNFMNNYGKNYVINLTSTANSAISAQLSGVLVGIGDFDGSILQH